MRFLVCVIFFSLSSPVHAASFLMGVDGTWGQYQISSGLPQKVGGGVSSGSDNLRSNSSTLRSYARYFSGYGGGLMVGFTAGKLGADVHGQYLMYQASGGVTRVSRGSSSAINVESGDINYSAFKAELGLRFYPARWLILRPHAGYVLNSRYQYTLKSPRQESDSEDRRLCYGASLLFVLGSGRFRLEFGGDLNTFNSQYGGRNFELVAKAAPTLYLGGK